MTANTRDVSLRDGNQLDVVFPKAAYLFIVIYQLFIYFFFFTEN